MVFVRWSCLRLRGLKINREHVRGVVSLEKVFIWPKNAEFEINTENRLNIDRQLPFCNKLNLKIERKVYSFFAVGCIHVILELRMRRKNNESENWKIENLSVLLFLSLFFSLNSAELFFITKFHRLKCQNVLPLFVLL